MALRVGLNLLHLVPGETGGAELYARRLIPALLASGRLQLTVFAASETADALAGEPWASEAEIVPLAVDPRSRPRLVAAEQMLLPRASKRAGVELLHNLSTFTGPVYPVHFGSRLLEPADLAVIAVPAPAVLDAVTAAAAAGVAGVVVVSSGFAETGPAGEEAQRELLHAVRAAGIRLVGPNCLGIANTDPAVRLNATLAPALPPHGRVGFFSQSGALGVALLDTARRRGLGLSTFVSAGSLCAAAIRTPDNAVAHARAITPLPNRFPSRMAGSLSEMCTASGRRPAADEPPGHAWGRG